MKQDNRYPTHLGGNPKSPLGGPRTDLDIRVDGNASEGDFKVTAVRLEDDSEAGDVDIKEWVLMSMEVDGKRSEASSVATELLRRACQEADHRSAVLLVPDASVAKSFSLFLNRFGFTSSKDGILERRPGAALPYSVLEGEDVDYTDRLLAEVDAFFVEHSKNPKAVRFERNGYLPATKHTPAFKRDVILGTREHLSDQLEAFISELAAKYGAEYGESFIATPSGRITFGTNYGTNYNVYSYSFYQNTVRKVSESGDRPYGEIASKNNPIRAVHEYLMSIGATSDSNNTSRSGDLRMLSGEDPYDRTNTPVRTVTKHYVTDYSWGDSSTDSDAEIRRHLKRVRSILTRGGFKRNGSTFTKGKAVITVIGIADKSRKYHRLKVRVDFTSSSTVKDRPLWW